MTAAAVAETLAREYPKTVVLKDGTHMVLRPAPAPEPDRVVIVAEDEGRVGGTIELALGGEMVRLSVILGAEYHDRRLGTWMLLDGVHLAGTLGAAEVTVQAPAGGTGLQAALRRLDFLERAPGCFVKMLHHGWTDF